MDLLVVHREMMQFIDDRQSVWDNIMNIRKWLSIIDRQQENGKKEQK